MYLRVFQDGLQVVLGGIQSKLRPRDPGLRPHDGNLPRPLHSLCRQASSVHGRRNTHDVLRSILRRDGGSPLYIMLFISVPATVVGILLWTCTYMLCTTQKISRSWGSIIVDKVDYDK